MVVDHERDYPSRWAAYKRAKSVAHDQNKPNFKVFASASIICAESDEEAQERLKYFNDGIDVECLEDIARGYQMNSDPQTVAKNTFTDSELSSVSRGTFVGSYENVARRLARTVIEGELDGIMLVVPDFVEDLKAVVNEVFTRMERHGVICGKKRA